MTCSVTYTCHQVPLWNNETLEIMTKEEASMKLKLIWTKKVLFSNKCSFLKFLTFLLLTIEWVKSCLVSLDCQLHCKKVRKEKKRKKRRRNKERLFVVSLSLSSLPLSNALLKNSIFLFSYVKVYLSSTRTLLRTDCLTPFHNLLGLWCYCYSQTKIEFLM